MRFEDFIAELEAEARAEGLAAVAELEAFRRAFASERRRHRESALPSLLNRLARVIHPAYVVKWLNTPILELDGDTPTERITSGDCRSVARLISGLEDPGAS